MFKRTKFYATGGSVKGSKKRKKKATGGFVSIRGQGIVMKERLR